MTYSIIKSNGAMTALLTFTLFSIASAQTSAANAQSDMTIRVDQLFGRFDRPDSPGCALGVIKDGKLIYKKGYGMSNLEHDIPISPTTVFNVASASTQFTAMSVLLLARQGKLRLDPVVAARRGRNFVLTPALKDEFLSGGFNFEFIRDPQNKVNGFLMDTDRSLNVRFVKRK